MKSTFKTTEQHTNTCLEVLQPLPLRLVGLDHCDDPLAAGLGHRGKAGPQQWTALHFTVKYGVRESLNSFTAPALVNDEQRVSN